MLSTQEQQRYARHLLLASIGESGQLKLKNATVMIIGLGGLGNPASMYLAAAGIGKLVLADGDNIEISNLQRQVMFKTDEQGENKAEVAAQHLQENNPEVDIEVIDEMIDEETLDYYLSDIDLVLDCTDNLATRLLINRLCWQHKTPLVVGAAIRAEGQLLVVNSEVEDAACYQCLLDENTQEPELNCATAGVMGPVLGIIGSAQALEAIKLITGKPIEHSKLRVFDGLSFQWQGFKLPKRTCCTVCNQ